MFDMKSFESKRLHGTEVKEQVSGLIWKNFAAVENVDENKDISRSLGGTGEDIKISLETV